MIQGLCGLGMRFVIVQPLFCKYITVHTRVRQSFWKVLEKVRQMDKRHLSVFVALHEPLVMLIVKQLVQWLNVFVFVAIGELLLGGPKGLFLLAGTMCIPAPFSSTCTQVWFFFLQRFFRRQTSIDDVLPFLNFELGVFVISREHCFFYSRHRAFFRYGAANGNSPSYNGFHRAFPLGEGDFFGYFVALLQECPIPVLPQF